MAQPPTALICPRCQRAMRERERETAGRDVVVMDVCPACGGIWLDKGELEKLVAAEQTYAHQEESPRADEGHDGDRGQQRGRRRGGFLGNLFDFD